MKNIISIISILFCCLFCTQFSNAQIQVWTGPDDNSGIWNHTNTNWGNGEIWKNEMGAFIDKGKKITVESTSDKPLLFQTLRFLGNDYSLTDGYLAIYNPDKNNNGYILVDKDKNATIGSILKNGSSINSLFKQGEGSLRLTGENQYTGGTHIEEGELLVEKDKNLGAPNSPLLIDNSLFTVLGDDFISTNRLCHLTGANCTIKIVSPSNTLEFTNLFDIHTSFYKDGPGTIKAPIRSLQSGDITVLDGTIEFSNTEWEEAEFLPANVKTGTLILSVDENKGTKASDLSGKGNIEKTGKGTLFLEGKHLLTGIFLHKEGKVSLKSNWFGDYEQSSKTRLDVAADIYIQGNMESADTIATNGALNIIENLSLSGATLYLKPGNKIKVEGNLDVSGLNTILLDKEPQLPISLLKVNGTYPTDAETSNSFRLKVGKETVTNSDYGFIWHEDELFFIDKTKPFPLQYTVSLEVSPDIVPDITPGSYTFMHGEPFSFNFYAKETSTPKEAISFMVNGKETPFLSFGSGYNYVYRISEVTEDYAIQVGLKKFKISTTIPKGASVSPSLDKEFKYGDNFTFTITLDENYSGSELKVYVNGKPQVPAKQDGLVYTFTLQSITDNINLRILGVTPNDPTSNIPTVSTQYPIIKTENGTLSIDMEDPATVTVFNLTGQVSAQVRAPQNHVSIPLKQGIYLVRIGTKVYKVVVL